MSGEKAQHLMAGRLVHTGSTAVTFCECGLAFAAQDSEAADRRWDKHRLGSQAIAAPRFRAGDES